MARNWASFLNEASRGYGLGFDRYQQYDQAREGREQRALVRGISDDLQTANAPVTTTREAVPMGTYGPGQSVEQVRQERAAVPTGPGMAQPAPQARAVETQAPDGPEPLPAPPGRQVPIPQGPQDDLFAQRLRAADKAAGRVSVPGGAQDGLFAERLAAADAEQESALPVPPSPTDKKAVAKHQTDTAVDILQEIEPASIRKVMKGGERIKVEGGRSRMDAFDAAKTKLRDLYARQGNVEGLLSVDAQFEAMQHDRMMSGLKKAMTLMAVDPQSAAEELAKAYSYLPDGTEMDIKVAPDGTLVGRGYDDVTGEFKETMQIDSEMLSQIYRYYEDPAQFHRDMADLRVANEQRAYDRGRDTVDDYFKSQDLAVKQADLLIKGLTAESQASLRSVQEEVYGMQAVKLYLDAVGAPGAAPLWDKHSDIRAALTNNESYFTKMRTGELPMPPSVEFGLNGSPLNPAALIEASNSMILLNGPASGLTNAQTARIAGDLGVMELSERGESPEDSDADRAYQTLREDLAKSAELQILGYDMEQNAGVVSHAGTPLLVNLTSMPALRMRAQSLQQARDDLAAGKITPEQFQQVLDPASVPQPDKEAVPLDPNAPGVRAGQATRRVAGDVANRVAQNPALQVPRAMIGVAADQLGQTGQAIGGFAQGLAADPNQ